MNRKTLAIILLQTLIIIVLFWLLVFYGKDEYEAYSHQDQEEAIASPPRVSSEEGATVVTLSRETQQQSGIVTSPLVAASYQGGLDAYGSVVNMDAYNDLRARYLAARAEASAVRAAIANSQKEYQRLVELNRDDKNVSDRAVTAAESAWKADQARLAAAETTAASLRDTLRLQWGETLANWATQQQPPEPLQRLQQRREVLIQITLPFDAPDPGKNAKLMVEPAGTRERPVQASYVSPAPVSDAAMPGKTFFYRAAPDSLRVGMRVIAHLARDGQSADGVIVPADAIIWYGGQAWVYRKESEERFVRDQVSTERESGNGWFNAGTLKAGDEVVTSGAQLLLSEEFKYQITNENED
ncbi:MAG: hypothetical protein LBE24_05220 [Methylobacillus sp.]|jgi:hypothetical protein|nr:hypothetical protein [Methylobacillus sp.]